MAQALQEQNRLLDFSPPVLVVSPSFLHPSKQHHHPTKELKPKIWAILFRLLLSVVSWPTWPVASISNHPKPVHFYPDPLLLPKLKPQPNPARALQWLCNCNLSDLLLFLEYTKQFISSVEPLYSLFSLSRTIFSWALQDWLFLVIFMRISTS